LAPRVDFSSFFYLFCVLEFVLKERQWPYLLNFLYVSATLKCCLYNIYCVVKIARRCSGSIEMYMLLGTVMEPLCLFLLLLQHYVMLHVQYSHTIIVAELLCLYWNV
jgi:hypothetical protein